MEQDRLAGLGVFSLANSEDALARCNVVPWCQGPWAGDLKGTGEFSVCCCERIATAHESRSLQYESRAGIANSS